MEFTTFEVLGPIMVGPSSSHTAGACRIAKVASKICSSGFNSVDFYLHGSFKATYKGHGTDKALIGGTLGFDTDDPRMEKAFEEAKEKGLNYSFHAVDLGEEYHPNSVKIVYNYDDHTEYVIGSSIGGGAMVIVNINGMAVEFRGKFPTLLMQYKEQKGVIAYVSSILSGNSYNIESINTVKNPLTEMVTLTVEVEKSLPNWIKDAILDYENFITAKYVEV